MFQGCNNKIEKAKKLQDKQLSATNKLQGKETRGERVAQVFPTALWSLGLDYPFVEGIVLCGTFSSNYALYLLDSYSTLPPIKIITIFLKCFQILPSLPRVVGAKSHAVENHCYRSGDFQDISANHNVQALTGS